MWGNIPVLLWLIIRTPAEFIHNMEKLIAFLVQHVVCVKYYFRFPGFRSLFVCLVESVLSFHAVVKPRQRRLDIIEQLFRDSKYRN